MEFTERDYFGKKMLEFKLNGRTAYLVCPETPCDGKPWLLKTEYFWAFPDFEKDMLNRGFHVAYIENATRWHKDSDDRAKHDLSVFLHEKFGLNSKCINVGMSCGGLQAIYYAAAYPEDIAGLYLDAPVVNLLSCPGCAGSSKGNFMDEFTANTGLTFKELLSYRNHPFDNLDIIFKNDIPIFIVAGDSDNIVPFDENGLLICQKANETGGRINLILKEDCDHHPHGLNDRSPLIVWAESLYKE